MIQKVSDLYGQFSAGQKRIADLFLEQPIVLAFSSALEVGRKVEVSESTVIRWSQKLGYRGYAEFQHVVQQRLAKEQMEQPDEQPQSEQSYLEKLLDAEIAGIEKLKQSLDEENLLKTVDMISEADSIYITGDFFVYGLAHSFASWLDFALGRTQLLTQGEIDYYYRLSRVTPGSTVVAFSFSRHTRTVTETVKTAKEQGARIIVITDSEKAPAIRFADLELVVPVTSNLGVDSYTAAQALLTSVMRFISAREHETVKANLSRTEALYRKKNIFH